MQKIKAKLMALITTICCFTLCLGFGIGAIVAPQTNNVVAQAASVRTITQLGIANGTTASTLYVYAVQGDACPDGVNNWDDKYTFVADSGYGIKFNNDVLDGYEMKQPGNDIYIVLGGKTAVAGDEVTIDGKFSHAAKGNDIVFENCGLRYNGTTWESFTPPTKYTINKLASTRDSNASVIYAYPTTEEERPAVNNWDDAFTFVAGSGKGALWNNQPFTISEMKQPGDFYINLGRTAVAGDEFILDGTFANTAIGVEIVFKNCGLRYNGSAWTTIVSFAEYKIGSLSVHGNSISGGATRIDHLYTARADGKDLPFESWGDLDFFTYESGTGVKVGDTTVSFEMKSTDAGLWFAIPNVTKDTIVTIGGTFVCVNKEARYVIEDTTFAWTGSKWVLVHEIGALSVHKNSITNADATKIDQLYTKRADGKDLPYPDGTWSTEFTYESGTGVKVGNTTISFEMQSTDAGLWFRLSGVTTEKVVTIGGTFYCQSKNARYVIEDSQFKWNGSYWESYVSYTQYKLGRLVFKNTYGEGKMNMADFYRVDGEDIPLMGEIGSDFLWGKAFSVREGSVGVTINGNKVDAGVKFPNNLFLELPTAPQKDDMLVIAGTFYNADLAVEYVIEESQFKWNGSAWVEYTGEEVAKEEKTVSLGKVVGIGNNSNANGVYLKFETTSLPIDSWTYAFTLETGYGITVNGVAIDMNNTVKSTGNTLYVNLSGVTKGANLRIGGTFVAESDTVIAHYVIEDSVVQFNGSTWVKFYQDSELETYDTMNLVNLGAGYGVNVSGGKDLAGLAYTGNGTKGSLKLQFGYYSANTKAGCIDIRLRGSAWDGVRFRILSGGIEFLNGGSVATFKNNTNYVIEIGVINLKGSDQAVEYIMVDGAIVAQKVVASVKTDDNGNDANSQHVSIYADAGIVGAYITHPNYVPVIYTKANGDSFTEYVNTKADYALTKARTYNAFIGWTDGENLYQEGKEIRVSKTIAFSAVEIDFSLQDGAAIRLASVATSSGIRFTSMMDEATYNSLVGKYGITAVSYGTLIMPYDYLGNRQAPNLENFKEEDKQILQIEASVEKSVVEKGYIIFRGAMQNVKESNYNRLFAGRGYIQITLENGESWYVYTPFDTDENVRSIRYVAQEFKADNSVPTNDDEIRYATVSAEKQAIVDAYAKTDTIELLDYAKYAANNLLEIVAWYYPELDPTNNYINAANDAVAEKMKAAGIKVVNLAGHFQDDINTFAAVEKTRKIIKFFWSKGIKTMAVAGNAHGGGKNEAGEFKFDNLACDFSKTGYPDFSDCEGFIGFIMWDEPSNAEEITNKIAALAVEFDRLYSGLDITFMVNLLPSYGFSSDNDFTNYLKTYCDEVLTKIKGEKLLSLDTYPVQKNKKLKENFLYDLAMLKTYSLYAGATSNVILQASAWIEENDNYNRVPEESELRMQAYAAMAFGIDSISWWSYAEMKNGGDNHTTPVENATLYQSLQNVNSELNTIGAVYSAFEWKGVIIGVGSSYDINNKDYNNEDRTAYNKAKNALSAYAVGDTKYLSSITNNKKAQNYLLGVMEDMYGNEGYVLCNYNSIEEDRSKTITIKFNTNITEAIVYHNGVKQTVEVSNKTLTLSLATGDGLIILPSKLG